MHALLMAFFQKNIICLKMRTIGIPKLFRFILMEKLRDKLLLSISLLKSMLKVHLLKFGQIKV
jgi:hypothetical protein